VEIILHKKEDLDWTAKPNIVETYLSDTLPERELCSTAFAFVFNNGKFLLIDSKEWATKGRRLDIPGGHVEEGETPEDGVIREVFEETGVVVKVNKLVGFTKIDIKGDKSEDYFYPYPVSYILFYICDFIEEKEFTENDETHGRVWLEPEDFHKSEWCVENKNFLDEVMKLI